MSANPKTRRMTVNAYDYISRDFMPVETMVSFPVPILRQDQLQAVLFAAMTVPLPYRSNCVLYRPPVLIYVDWSTEQVIEHVLTPHQTPLEQEQPVGMVYPAEFAGPMNEDLEQRIYELHWSLYRLLDEIGPLYPRQDLTSLQREQLSRCDQSFRRAVTAEVLPLYRELNPDFFRWLAGTADGSSCPRCQASNPPGSRFCNQCGNSLHT
jgi:hypothetical protein